MRDRSRSNRSATAKRTWLCARDDLAIQQLTLDAARGIMGYLFDSNEHRLYELWDTRAIAMLERLKSSPIVHAREVFLLSYQHRARANALMFSGESARTRRDLERDLHRLGSVRDVASTYREFVLSEALTLAELGRWSGELTPLEPSVRSRPAIIDVKLLESCLGELTSLRIGWLPSLTGSYRLITEDLPTQTWTDRVISSIKSDASKFALDHTRIPAIGWSMRHQLRQHNEMATTGRQTEQRASDRRSTRRAGRTAHAIPPRSSRRLYASERRICSESKKRMSSRWAPMIGWERKALDAAVHAATLEPDNDEVRNLVKNRHVRLDKLVSQ